MPDVCQVSSERVGQLRAQLWPNSGIVMAAAMDKATVAERTQLPESCRKADAIDGKARRVRARSCPAVAATESEGCGTRHATPCCVPRRRRGGGSRAKTATPAAGGAGPTPVAQHFDTKRGTKYPSKANRSKTDSKKRKTKIKTTHDKTDKTNTKREQKTRDANQTKARWTQACKHKTLQ